MKKNIELTLQIFKQSGFTVNRKKSVLKPVQQLSFLGFDINTVKYTVSVTKQKRSDLLDIIMTVLKNPQKKITIRLLAKIVGKIVAMFPASLHARLNYRILDRFKVKALLCNKQRWTAKVKLPPNCIKQLTWWKSNVFSDKLTKSLHTADPKHHLYCDASGKSWGAVLNKVEAKAHFSDEQRKLSINTKELLAVLYGLQSHVTKLRNDCTLIYSDNFTTVSTIRCMSSADKLRDKIVGRIYQLCFDNNIEIKITYIKGKNNFLADKASRSVISNEITEFSCHPDTVKFIKNRPEFICNIDMFSSHLNNILPTFASWYPCPGSIMTDCFNLNWSNWIPFLHPPCRLISKTLRKLDRDRVQIAQGIFPIRPSAAWWTNLVLHMKSPPILLPKNTARKLFIPWDKTIRHPLWRKMRMCFVSLCATCFVDQTCQKDLQITLHNMLGVTQQRNISQQIVNVGYHSQRKRKLADMISP